MKVARHREYTYRRRVVHVKIVNMVNLMLWTFYQNKKSSLWMSTNSLVAGSLSEN